MNNKMDMLRSPSKTSSIDKIKAFHRRFVLEEAGKSDKEAFFFAIQKILEKIVIHSPDDGYRTKAVIHLLSGVKLMLQVEKDYSTDVFPG